MSKYEINLNDATTDVVEASSYIIDGGWVMFTGEHGEPLNAYPATHVERISVAAKHTVQEPLRITIEPPVFAGDADEVARVAKRIIKDYAGYWGTM